MVFQGTWMGLPDSDCLWLWYLVCLVPPLPSMKILMKTQKMLLLFNSMDSELWEEFLPSRARVTLLGKRAGDTREEIFQFVLLSTSHLKDTGSSLNKSGNPPLLPRSWFRGHVTATTPYCHLYVFSPCGASFPETRKVEGITAEETRYRPLYAGL